MGQATSTSIPRKSNVFYNYDDFSNRFTKVTLSTLAVPMVVIAFPMLNAYTFTEEELTGVKVMDGMIGGLLGIIGCGFSFVFLLYLYMLYTGMILITFKTSGPLAPFLACWGMFEVIFKDGPPEPLPIPPELKKKAKREIGLNCEDFYNVAVVGVSGTGKVGCCAARPMRRRRWWMWCIFCM